VSRAEALHHVFHFCLFDLDQQLLFELVAVSVIVQQEECWNYQITAGARGFMQAMPF
jgi:hypothetical protein